MNATNDELKVPKSTLSVRLRLHGQRPRPVELFVPHHGARPRQEIELRDLLEQRDLFVPAHDAAGDHWLLFNRNAVVWIALDVPTDGGEGVELYEKRAAVRVDLADGSPPLEGELLFSKAATGERVADHLNERDEVLFVYFQDEIYLVNKREVVAVTELGTTETAEDALGQD